MPPPYQDIKVPLRPREIEAALADLATTYGPLCQRTVFGTKTARGKEHSYIKIANGSGAKRPAVLIIGGVHANEWAPPDALVTFARNLLVSYDTGTDVVFPAMTVAPNDGPPVAYREWRMKASDVNAIISAVDLYLFPNVNPDGREWELSHPTPIGWRKNRRGPANAPYGVDLNRNFDIIREFEKYYDVALYKQRYGGSEPAGTQSSQDTYRGDRHPTTHQLVTEPEVSHVQQLLDTLPIRYFVDVHMEGRKILFSWGMEEDGDDPAMRFDSPDPKFIGKRDGLKSDDALWATPPMQGITDYKEYLPDDPPHRIRSRAELIARVMRGSIMLAATGHHDPQVTTPQQHYSNYTVGQSAFLYLPVGGGPNSGCSDDYACSRQFVHPERKPIFAYTLETGHSDEQGQHPSYDDQKNHFRKINREIHAALFGLLQAAAAGCFIATAAMGTEDHPDVEYLRALRDERLRATPRGARVADVLNRVYYSFSPAVARYLDVHPRARKTVRVLVIRPLAAALRRIFGAEGGGR
ncbi:M14 family zinc carboxypeptidase [Actinophytocola sp.]|uniref:M14 family zinc carboxypeptidase n=1 Tax=Actinophytocola sp. TaxID=1872138 RepID=UPI00389A1334